LSKVEELGDHFDVTLSDFSLLDQLPLGHLKMPGFEGLFMEFIEAVVNLKIFLQARKDSCIFVVG
jgi:hypothetical protein